MKDKTIYAVVDIETTGTSTEKDKIIQFACVLVQNREIINHFSTDVNPLQKIPKHIEQLTGISNQQVATAPYFEDIAPIIKNLLSDCVFVAHNVYFDFAFLNSEFKRSGEETLVMPCIDTVELAQILYPKSQGFRVADLAEYFDISHENPHQALSDATVTAEIFIQLHRQIETIPYVTLKKMAELSVYLGVDNHLLFQEALKNKESHPLNQLLDQVKTIDMVSLKIKNYQFQEKKVEPDLVYPVNLEEKEALLNGDFSFRDEQIKMMDKIAAFVANSPEKKNLMVEAATGTGKSLGYLFPLSFNLRKPITISTSTIMLQEQLLEESIPQLETIISREVTGLIVKSSRHFIDLHRFYQTLLAEPNHQKQYIINQMAVLNWLRETETGDLDELNLNKNHLFFEHVEHRGLHTLKKDSLFFEEDFLRFLEAKKQVADLILINHAFLCEDSFRQESLLPESSILVIDEAHKLVHTLEDKQLVRVSFRRLYSLLKKMREIDDLKEHGTTLKNTDWLHQLDLLPILSVEGRDDLQWLETFMMSTSGLSTSHPEKDMSCLGEYAEWPIAMKKNVKELMTIIREMNEVIDCVLVPISGLMKQLNGADLFTWLEYANVLTAFKEESQKLVAYFKHEENEQTRLIGLEKQHLVLKAINFEKISIQETTWYNKFDKLIFTSGTLQLDIASDYFENQLDLPEPEKLLLGENFSYENQAELLVVTDFNDQDSGNFKKYIAYLAHSVRDIYLSQTKSMLVLFTSHQVLQAVYQELNNELAQEEVELFAQGITGTKEKIAKRFAQSSGGIILGANSFWEGVDFNLPDLDIIVMTKLPFDPPKRPLIEAKYRYLEQQGKNPFYDEAIPQAGSRLRQGLGRLLRSETDKGIVVVLDSRMTLSSYSSKLLNYLPKGLKVTNHSLEETLTEMTRFFTEK